MSINDFFTILFVVTRPVWDTDKDGNSFSTPEEVSSFMGHIQQASPELIETLALNFSEANSIWCPLDTDVKAGDTLQSIKGAFSVKAIQKFDNGSNKHMQIVALKNETEPIGS